MRIACLQLAPKLGEVEANMKRADTLLEEAGKELQNLDLLVLPEMAFSGYNFPSLEAISPFLEPTSAGPSTQWAIRTAKKLRCVVNVGYPEKCNSTSTSTTTTTTTTTTSSESVTESTTTNYNTVVSVHPDGSIGATTRKTFLYYTDETWATESPAGFWSGALFPLPPPPPPPPSPPPPPHHHPHTSTPSLATPHTSPPRKPRTNLPEKVAMGICMDINPHQFTAPWEAYEFATHCVSTASTLVVLSMAWLTRLDPAVLLLGGGGGEEGERKEEPDMQTVLYWISRFVPVVRSSSSSSLASSSGGKKETLIVMANRSGTEPGTLNGLSQGLDPVTGEDIIGYAGSSCVMRVREGEVQIYDLMGKAEEGVLVVDSDEEPKYAIRARWSGDEDGVEE